MVVVLLLVTHRIFGMVIVGLTVEEVIRFYTQYTTVGQILHLIIIGSEVIYMPLDIL